MNKSQTHRNESHLDLEDKITYCHFPQSLLHHFRQLKSFHEFQHKIFFLSYLYYKHQFNAVIFCSCIFNLWINKFIFFFDFPEKYMILTKKLILKTTKNNNKQTTTERIKAPTKHSVLRPGHSLLLLAENFYPFILLPSFLRI